MIFLWFLLILCFSQSYGSSEWNPNKRKFPPDFRFGAATAAYQVEGGWNTDGKGESILDHYYHSTPARDGATGDVTAASHRHWRRDVEMLRQLGVDHYRLSVAWSRVLPTGLNDNINEDGLKYYDDLIEELNKYNIEPMVTMYYYDLPQQLQEKGGWTNPLVVQWFKDYATVLFDRFAKKVKYWITINNPGICFDMYSGGMPPALHSEGVGDYLCAKHMLLAHANVYKLYEKYRSQSKCGQIGIAININWADPVDMNKPKHKEATEIYRNFAFGLFLHPIWGKSGDWPAPVKEIVAKKSREEGLQVSRLPELDRDEIQLIRKSSDFLGMNHYTSHLVSPRAESASENATHPYRDIDVALSQGEQWAQAKSSWLRGAPYGLYKACVYLNTNYAYPPIMITEHGFSTDTGVADSPRIENSREYLKAALFALEDGTDLRGLTFWTLVDGFQWGAGLTERFGLFEVDFESPNKTRTPRRSAFFIRDVIDHRRVHDDWKPKTKQLKVSERRMKAEGVKKVKEEL